MSRLVLLLIGMTALLPLPAVAQSQGRFPKITVEGGAGDASRVVATDTNQSDPISTPSFFFFKSENYDKDGQGNQFNLPFIIQHNGGGTGPRQTLTVNSTFSGSNQGDFLVGQQTLTQMTGGSGFMIPYSPQIVAKGPLKPGSQFELVEGGIEVRPDDPSKVLRKVGINLIDNSSALGLVVSNAYMMTKVAGSVGWQNGYFIGGQAPADAFPIAEGGTMIGMQPNSVNMRAGLDFKDYQGTFSEAAISLPLRGNRGIAWGSTGTGGSISAATGVNGPQILFGNNALVVRSFGNNIDYLSVNPDGIRSNSGFISPLQTPASNSPCTVGKTVNDANFHYVCVASNKWRRVALTDY